MKAVVLLTAGAIGAVSLLGLTSCSDDKKVALPSDFSVPINASSGNTLPDISLPPTGASIPGNIPGISDECATYYAAFAAAFSGGNEELFNQIPGAFDALEAKVPDDLRDDVGLLGQAYVKLGEVYKKYGYDFSKAAVDPAVSGLFNNPQINESSQRVAAWVATQCGTQS